MAAPSLVAKVTGDQGSNQTSVAVSMPAASNGDLLIVMYNTGDVGNTTTSSSGWTKLGEVDGSGHTTAVFAGIMGTAASLTMSHGSDHSAWVAASFTGWSGDLADVELTTASGSGAPYAPPSISPSHGTYDYLYACALGVDFGAEPSAGPSGWSGFDTAQTGNFGTNAAIGFAYLETAASSSVNPPPFTVSASRPWSAFTIAIPPELSTPQTVGPDTVTATEGTPNVAFSGATDSATATEGTAGVTANIPGGVATDTATAAEGTATIAASGAADDAAAIEATALLTVVGPTDTTAVTEDSPGIAFSGATDTIEALEDALVTQTAEVDPDVVVVAEGLAEVIPLHEVADQVLTQEDALVTTTITAEDSFGITESTGPFGFSVSDSFGWSEYAFNFGDGLEIRHPRKHRVARATRGHSIFPDYRTHQIERAIRIHAVN